MADDEDENLEEQKRRPVLHPLDPKRLREDWMHKNKSRSIHPEYATYIPAGVYCPRCGIDRRVIIQPLYIAEEHYSGAMPPSLGSVHCLQCQLSGAITLYHGPTGIAVSVQWPQIGGLATPNTPKGVGFYLDQAARCESANANSAAVAMYRAALDHLMFAQGYKNGMLGQRIKALIADVDNGKAPRWAMDLDHAYLDVISKLGNGAIHTNDGDVSKQDALDEELLGHLHAVFTELLDVVYEEPARRAARLQKLQTVAGTLNKK